MTLTFTNHIFPSSRKPGGVVLALVVFCLIFITSQICCQAQALAAGGVPHTKRVLMIFSEAGDLPGSAMMELAAREEMTAHSTNPMEFFTESLDESRFASADYHRQFGDFLSNKYAGQNLDLVMAFMSRDFKLADDIPASVVSNLPVVYVALGEMEVPDTLGERPFGGIVQRLDIQGTIKFILQLQPETRRVVVVGGVSTADRTTMGLIQKAAGAAEGVQFEFWTNRPMAETVKAVASLPNDTVVLLSSVQRDVTGRPLHTSQAAQMLAPSASVPVYGMGGTLIGSGVLGGKIVDMEWVGAEAGRLALRALDKGSAGRIPGEVRSNGVSMVDWRALQRWHIKASRLPTDCVVRYRPYSAWESHRTLILFVGVCLLAQAITIVALLAQRRLHRRAEAELLLQRTELAHVARISTMGQLASALTHELNQPLGAILKNTEAAEIFLQNNPPNLEEIRAILTDIRRDDRRAGRVIDRMRSLYKRRSLALDRLDLRDLVEDTVAMTRPDADARQIKVTVQVPPHLPEAQGDRVHVQQVLLNLILNAMDAMSNTPKPRRSLVIRVLETKNGNLQMAVSDQGSGITTNDAANIFEPFFTTKPDGMGMGLAISQTIIEAHGGCIWLESSAMKGTTFTFILPPAGLAKVKDGDLPAAR